MGCEVGKYYPTRYGNLKLLGKEDVSDRLVVIPEDLGVARIGWNVDMRLRSGFISALYALQAELYARQRIWAMLNDFPVEKIIKVKIVVNSAFRPIGETCGSGVYADLCGALDSHDKLGHHTGWAGDFSPKTRKGYVLLNGTVIYKPKPTIRKYTWNLAVVKIGLETPFLGAGEWWHYRPLGGWRS